MFVWRNDVLGGVAFPFCIVTDARQDLYRVIFFRKSDSAYVSIWISPDGSSDWDPFNDNWEFISRGTRQ